MKLEVRSEIAVFAICATFVLAIFNKWWDAIAAHIGYPLGVQRRLRELEAKVDQLNETKTEVHRRDPSPICEDRKGWLRRVTDLVKRLDEMQTILRKLCALNYFGKCKIGREADDEHKKADSLIGQISAIMPEEKISTTRKGDRLLPVPTPLPGMKSLYEEVIKFFKDDSPKSVIKGIWGMGGVGKTTLLHLVRDSRALYYDCFDEVVLVLPGKGCTEVADLQKAIATSMGLTKLDETASEITLGNIIRMHLENKNFLLLLDDLWMHLNLEVLGIPPLKEAKNEQTDIGFFKEKQTPKRKVLFTTRSREVCYGMGCSDADIVNMKCLNREHAWNLFKKSVVIETIFDHPEIGQLAEEIAEECKGLPVALCIVGKLMSPKEDPREWRIARDLLKNSMLYEMTDIREDLFKRLQKSYDDLRTAAMKECFLLCSLWPENESISVKTLTMWWKGLGLLDRFSNASDLGYTFTETLVRKSMLEKGESGLDSAENTHVKMHNMIRMMAIRIVNEQGYMNKWLPNSSCRSALPQDNWHKVEKAWVSHEDTSEWCQWSPTVRFPQLKMLVGRHLFSLNLMIRYFQTITFLDLEGMRRGGFPLEICKLTNLQHLNLSATRIGILPIDLNKLIYLKYLYIRNNMYLQTIPKGLIFALKSLKGLDLFHTGASFINVLTELESFAENLDMLGFTVRKIAEITQLVLLKRVCTQALYMHKVEDMSNPDIINLEILSDLTELRELTIVQSFHSQTVLVAEGAGPDFPEQLLRHLEIFELKNLLNLRTVTWNNAGINIRVVSIYKCDGLKDVTWVHNLICLEQLSVVHCQEMVILIDQTATVSFPKLQKLTLEVLPKLSMISRQACEFKRLSYICVTRCNAVNGIHDQQYKQLIEIHCSEHWWEASKFAVTSHPCLRPTFFS
ncbi:hypothetical protein ACQ4PT_003875 [Festuca glaucescens]